MSCSIEARGLSYKIAGEMLFEDVTLSLSHKEKVVIYGSNGCGKSTLLKILGGLKSQSAGELFLFHKKMESLEGFTEFRRDIGFLFQDSDDQFLSPSVLEDVAFGLLNIGVENSLAMQKSLEILEHFGIAHLKSRVPLKLSGGQKKLVALAGVLVLEPNILLLDEPSSGLDDGSLSKLIEIIKETSATTLIVSHDKEFVRDLGFKTLKLTSNGLV